MPQQAEAADDTPKEVLAQTGEFGLTLLNIPEASAGSSEDRSAVTGVLVAEALAEGDMGQAVACLAPSAVATAISLWGSDGPAADLPARRSPATTCRPPRWSSPSRVPLFDPFDAATTAAKRAEGGYVLNGVKSAVVRGSRGRAVRRRRRRRGPRPVAGARRVEHRRASTIEADPEHGSARRRPQPADRSTDVHVGRGRDPRRRRADDYRECIRLSRLAWAGLALGTGAAVLDYVKEYVKTREAFGEPIAHRQAVAFMVANIAIELEGMRLVTLKAASRAEQGLDFSREVALARRLAAEYGMKIGTDGVQLLGGHGFVKEHPVERWYRDLRAVGLMEGAVLV